MSSEIEPFDLDLSDVDLGIDELGDQDELPTEYDGQATYQAAGMQPVVVAGRMGRAASAQTSRRSTQNAQDSDMPVPAQATQGSKRARLKEKNRLAQARYRQRKLQELKELEDKMAETQQRLALAKARLKSSQDFSGELAQRCRAVTAAMLRLTDPSSTAARQRAEPTDPFPPRSAHAIISASVPSDPTTTPPQPSAAPTPMHAPQAYDLRAHLHSGPLPPNPIDSSNPAVQAGAPADAMGGHQSATPAPQREPLLPVPSVSNSPLLPMMPKQLPLPSSAVLAPLDPPAVFQHLAGDQAPLPGGPMLLSLQLFSTVNTFAGSGRHGSAAHTLVTAEALVRRLHGELSARLAAAAEAAAVEPARVAWFLQAPYALPDGRPLAFSTALASPACLASKFVFVVTCCLESTFLSSALSHTPVREGQATDATGTPDKAAEAVRNQQGGHDGTCATRSAAASAAARETLARMAAVIHHYPSCSTSLHASCGVGGLFNVATGVPHIVHSMCQRYRQLLPRAVWIETCAAFARLMLQQRSNQAPTQPCSIHGVYGDADTCGGDGAARAEHAAHAQAEAMPPPRAPRAGGDFGEDTSSSGSCSQRSRAGVEVQSAADASAGRSGGDAQASDAADEGPGRGEKRNREGAALHPPVRAASAAGLAEMGAAEGGHVREGPAADPQPPLPAATDRTQAAERVGGAAGEGVCASSTLPEAGAAAGQRSAAATDPAQVAVPLEDAAGQRGGEQARSAGVPPRPQSPRSARERAGPQAAGRKACDGGGKRRRCAHGEALLHDVATCPRCGVLACIAETMQKVLQEVVEDASAASDTRAQAALDAAAAAGELRVRTQELYAAYAVFLSQCSTDAPHLTRHLNLNSSSSDPQEKSADKMTVKLFQQLRLPPRQTQLSAAAAEYWHSRRRKLDIDLRLANGPLAHLPTASSLPRAAIRDLCGLELPDPTPVPPPSADPAVAVPTPPAPPPRTSMTPASPSEEPGGGRVPGTRLPTVRQAGREPGDAVDRDEDVEQGACMLCGRYGCSAWDCQLCTCGCTCGRAAAAWQRRLLGCDPAASAAARAAVRRLRAFQAADSELFADIQRAVRMPGCLFTAEQMVTSLPTALQYSVPFVDWLRVCQTAAGEARVEQLRADGETMGYVME